MPGLTTDLAQSSEVVSLVHQPTNRKSVLSAGVGVSRFLRGIYSTAQLPQQFKPETVDISTDHITVQRL